MIILGHLWNGIKRHWKGFLIGVGVLILYLQVQSCTKAKTEAKNSPLPPGVKEVISVSHGEVTIQTKTSVKHISGVRSGKLSIKDDNTTVLETKDKGFEHALGFDGAIAKDGWALGLDLRWGYWKSIDGLIGVNYYPRPKALDIWTGAGYTFNNSWISNTTIFIGYSVRQNVLSGISVKF